MYVETLCNPPLTLPAGKLATPLCWIDAALAVLQILTPEVVLGVCHGAERPDGEGVSLPAAAREAMLA